MATLTQTAYWTRKGMLVGTIVLIGFIVLKVSLTLAGNVWRKIHPPPPPPPTVAFGKLPKLAFPEQNPPAGETKLIFKLETIQGGLPKLSTIGKVYFMPKEGPNLLALDRARQKAQKMGFRSQSEKVSETVYRWTDQKTPPTTLEMDINTGNFYLRYPYEDDQALLTSKNLPPNQQAASEARNFLASNGLLTDDLATGSAEFDYLRFTPPTLVSAISLSEADFVRVNLFRASLDSLKILPPNPKESLISFLFSGSRELGKRIIEINYNYFPVEKETFATYPLKPINTAWQELQGGQGYIANLGQNEQGQITIRQVYLGYYDAKDPQNFLQPIYVFEGDKNFFGYVSAIDPKWTE